MQIWADLEGHLITQWNINFKTFFIFENKNRMTKKNPNQRSCQKSAKSGTILRLKRINPQIPQLLSNFPRFVGFWEFPNHTFLFPICYRITLDLGNFPRSGTTAR
jgi:hypothetical protein